MTGQSVTCHVGLELSRKGFSTGYTTSHTTGVERRHAQNASGLHPHPTEDELYARYRPASDSVERSRWHFLWLLGRGLTASAVARATAYSAYWIGQVAKRFYHDGPDGMRDPRHRPQDCEDCGGGPK